MDLMAELHAYRSSDEQVRARQARRTVRSARVYEQIALALGKPSVVTRARTAQRWNIRPDDAVDEGSLIGSQHPGAAALLIVRQALGEYRLPTNVELRYAGMKRASGHSAFNVDEGIIFIEATLHSLSGPQHHVDVPVLVRGGRILSPSIIIHSGNKRVMAQSTFDDIIGMGEFKASVPDRAHMFAPGPDHKADARTVPLLRPGMFKVSPSRQLIAGAVTGFYNPDVTGYVEPGTLGKDVPGADRSHVDVGERSTKGMFTPGQKVRLKQSATARDRGGVRYDVPKGSRGTVIRDVDGANFAFYVKFEELGFTCTVPREAMAA